MFPPHNLFVVYLGVFGKFIFNQGSLFNFNLFVLNTMLSKNNFIGHDLFILQRLNCLFKTPAKDYFANTIGTMTLRQKINAPSTYDAESDDNLCNNEQTTHKHSVASKRSLTKIYDQKFDEYETKLGDIGFKLSKLFYEGLFHGEVVEILLVLARTEESSIQTVIVKT